MDQCLLLIIIVTGNDQDVQSNIQGHLITFSHTDMPRLIFMMSDKRPLSWAFRAPILTNRLGCCWWILHSVPPWISPGLLMYHASLRMWPLEPSGLGSQAFRTQGASPVSSTTLQAVDSLLRACWSWSDLLTVMCLMQGRVTDWPVWSRFLLMI